MFGKEDIKDLVLQIFCKQNCEEQKYVLDYTSNCFWNFRLWKVIQLLDMRSTYMR
jgi:hypothetical protein